MQETELKALQKIWYRKLKDSGFHDIENENSKYLNDWHSTYFHTRYTPESFELKEEYYRIASQFLHDYPFKNQTEEAVWRLHSEGVGYREIGKKLDLKFKSNGRDSVFKIIKRLQEEMRCHDF